MSGSSEYDSKFDWGCFCQGGNSGIVLPKGSFDKMFKDDPIKGFVEGVTDKESYTTAFFEAFPEKPSCFLRGEGKTIEEAEKSCWEKYQKVKNCNHEMERRDRTDGYGYCKHCSYSSMVFEPLTKCCKCKKPTNYTKDYKGNHYCEKHARFKLKNPNPSSWEMFNQRLPRKRKKLLKKCAKKRFESENIFGKVTFEYNMHMKFKCNNKQFTLLFKRHEKELIERYN